jgi:hypothetical protein
MYNNTFYGLRIMCNVCKSCNISTRCPHDGIMALTIQNHHINIASRAFKNITKFKYLRTAVTDRNLISEEIKLRLNLNNTCYHSVQNL